MRFVLAMWMCTSIACVDSRSPTSDQQATTATCDGQLYDGCTSDDQCESGLCKLYSNRDLQVCTQECSATSPCPSQAGAAVYCNNMGFCRPDAPNACAAP